MKKFLYIFVSLFQFGVCQIKEQFPFERNSVSPINIYFNKTIFPIFETDSCRVDFHFNIPHNFLIYTKHTDTSFKAQCEIALEIRNKINNRSEARKMQIKELIFKEPPSPTSENKYFTGIFSFILKKGKYQIIFEVRDKESSRLFIDNKKEFEIPEPLPYISELFFIQPFDTSNINEAKIHNITYDDIIPYNQAFCTYLEFNQYYFQNIIPDIELFELPENQRNKIPINQNFILINSKRLIPKIDSSYYFFEEHSLHSGLLIYLPYQNLRTGKYELVIKIPSKKYPVKKNFQIQWMDMPSSLKDFRFAIDLLDYIATPEQIREMKVLNPKVKDKFEDFWKKLDPTPETMYNEAMAEYYKRADYAIEHFSTIKGDLGAKTDRGKIYILYGQPNNIERLILPRTTPKEFWIYKNLSKKFIFEDKNLDGNYKLIKIETL